jgi:magnesium transporter
LRVREHYTMAIRIFDLNNGTGRKWVDITDPDEKELEDISAEYRLNRHIVKDCLDPDHLPKHEKLEHATFLILRLFSGNAKQHLHTMQELTTKLAIFYNEDFLITIHRIEQPMVEEVKAQELDNHDDCTTAGIVTRILWKVLDSYGQPAMYLGEQIDTYEATVLLKHTKSTLLQGLYFIKRKASVCKKLLLLTGDTISFLRTTHANQSSVQDVSDLYTKMLMLYDQVLDDVTNLLSTYLSLNSQKTNEVVKVLTIFSVFFMPLTFIVGIYGMNFRFMPELHSRWGYPVVLITMAVITLSIFLWFRKRKWL